MTAKQQSPLSAMELSAFCSQMAMILRAGIPEREGLRIMRDDASDTATQSLMTEMTEASEMGIPFSQVLRDSGVFPKYMLDMIEVGECSGKLDEVLDALSAYYERERNIWSAVKNAVTYPLIMLTLMMLVIMVLSIKVLPIFGQVFAQLGAQASVFADGVLSLGSIMGNISIALVAVMAISIIAILVMRLFPSGRTALSAFFSACPITGNIASKMAAGRFAGAMALMISSGMDTERSIDMAGKLVGHKNISKKVEHCKHLISSGISFSDSIAMTGIFPGIFSRMIAVGFKTGNADEIFQKLANRYEQEISDDIASLVNVIEPTLVALLSVVVGLILLSVMLPLMGIMSSIG